MRHEFVIGADAGRPARVGGSAPLLVIAGPCVIEDEDTVLRTAEALADTCGALEVGFVFKSSYLKDNRTAVDSFVGPGPESGLRTLERVRREVGVPVLADVHERAEIAAAAEVLDVLQIPAFLCRQTRLLTEAAATGRCVNVKKGQFLSPSDVRHLVTKYESTGTGGLLLTERGTTFGYGNLVVDMRALEIMRGFGYPVVFDVTHSLQMPGGAGNETGGDRRFAPLMARAACAAGVEALFLESHPDPSRARSDKHTQIPVTEMRRLLETAREFHRLERQRASE
ncbi:MAG: 3-deoxy-8-phosphooctulonate synthase [Candidatus Latescibacterota bacterium]|nr:MAG: 3-deoxy-8-phosphooctulonate synthase [Candidatus Latescibacterota bacterium]